jgi:hypothetical protein
MTIDVDAELARIKEKKREAAGNGRSNESAGKRVLPWPERICDAAALQQMEFPTLKFILPSLIPEGATLLVSRPKLGKSWLVLDIAIATAATRCTLGDLKPSPGAVLLLALEDGKRRLQRRITRLLPTFSGKWPERLKIATEWPRADQGGLADIEAWIQATPNARLVIIDTLAQFRTLSNGKTQPYADDYAAISGLQKLASKHNIGIVVVHHDRKAEADDVFDTSGFKLSLSSESSVSSGIPSLNQPRATRSTPRPRVKPTQRGEQLRTATLCLRAKRKCPSLTEASTAASGPDLERLPASNVSLTL